MQTLRRGVFETNSSSTHSITMCLESEYEKWKLARCIILNVMIVS